MSRSLLAVGVSLVGALGAALPARADYYTFEGPAAIPGYGLSVVDGKVRLVKTSYGLADWQVEWSKSKPGDYLRLGEGYGKYTGRYLSYDPTGKDKTVFLTKKPGPGSYWTVFPRAKHTAIKAAAGKLKGWYLDAGDAAETVKDNEKNTSITQKVILINRPRRAPLFHPEVQAP